MYKFQTVKLALPTDYAMQLYLAHTILRLTNSLDFVIDSNATTLCIDTTDFVWPSDLRQYRCVWVLDFVALDDDIADYQKVNRIPHDNVVLITQNFSPNIPVDARIHVVNYDFLHNRTKLYHTANLDSSQGQSGHKPWYYNKSEHFSRACVPVEFFQNQSSTGQLLPGEFRKKKFLFAGRKITPGRTVVHKTLKEYSEQGYLFYKTTRCVEEQALASDWETIPNYQPLPVHYYLDSYINCYVETNMRNEIWQRTEKTLEPVMRFQMILPLASAGFLQYLAQIGITVVPELIHVPWDHIVDRDQRVAAYCSNLKSVMKYSIADLSAIYYNNLGLLLKNYRAVLDQPYCQGIHQALNYI